MLLIFSVFFVAVGYYLLLAASPDDYQKAVGMALAGITFSIAGGGMLVIYMFRRITQR